MKHISIFLLIFFFALPASGQDMREAYQKADQKHKAALSERKAAEIRIFENRKSLEEKVASLNSGISSLNKEIESLRNETNKLIKKEAQLASVRSRVEMDMQEFIGTTRLLTRDLETILRQSSFSARFPHRTDSLKPILEKGYFPDMEDMKTVCSLFFQEMELNGEVNLQNGSFVDRSGIMQNGSILTIGNFTAAYRTADEVGFLKYSEEGRHFSALSELPPSSIRRNIRKYIEGNTADICLDLSGGAALRQITHKLTLLNQIERGGPIVWPILAIGFVAFILIIERIWFIRKVRHDTDPVMEKVTTLLSREKWDECRTLLSKNKGKPVFNVLLSGLSNHNKDRQVLENVLQESMLRELPRLERFLPTINVLGAIAPLLGLLGTVTGMISTFHAITLYGSGDPRMMSGGISEALVTTELGLAVAIPVMFLHTFLSRRIDGVVGDMEEKAVAFTNIACAGGSNCSSS